MPYEYEDAVTPNDASHVLAVMGEGGYTPGNFVRKVIEAACVADRTNLARLSLGFPGIVGAVSIYKFEEGGVAKLRKIAEGVGQ